MVTRLRTMAAALGLALTACAADEVALTEVMVVVDSDLSVPNELDELLLRVEGPNGVTKEAVAQLSESPLPRSLGLVHEEGALAPLHVLVIGRVNGRVVLEREASLAFVEGRTVVLPMHLVRACIARWCGSQACSEHGCVERTIDPATLEDWSGTEPKLASGSNDAGSSSRDAGSDGGSDAGRDGGMCQPRAETCNGLDDDCDGVVDDGSLCGSGRLCCNGACSRNC